MFTGAVPSTPFGPPRVRLTSDYLAEAGPKSGLLSLARQSGLPSPEHSLVLCSGPNSDGTELFGVAATLLRDGYSPDLASAVRRADRYVAAASALRLRRHTAGSGLTIRSPAHISGREAARFT